VTIDMRIVSATESFNDAARLMGSMIRFHVQYLPYQMRGSYSRIQEKRIERVSQLLRLSVVLTLAMHHDSLDWMSTHWCTSLSSA
jgi:hypothetical protein